MSKKTDHSDFVPEGKTPRKPEKSEWIKIFREALETIKQQRTQLYNVLKIPSNEEQCRK